ncbi:MAG TPA: serine/threonine-protein kinase, partial [Thermoanaerobaculia bacterium]
MIAPGTQLGSYRVEDLIGQGGMGQVYRATDTRLDRTVAIKVLPSHLSSSPALRERFEREARAISSLSHPHICTLYDVGNEDGTEYLVMEYVEGESLADRLTRGPLPLDQVLRNGSEIAEALAAAHKRGIVHRDLKPGNVMITKGGAKLLDFGLAKAGVTATVSADALTEHQKPLTAEGTILGTFQYMAPEQLEGLEADPRTDIFALGVVLYEMATGRRAFEGKTRTSLIAAIVAGEPRPLSESQPLATPSLEHVIERCLAKEPDDRWQSARDIASELRWIAQKKSSSESAAPSRSRMNWVAGLLLVVAALAVPLAITSYLRSGEPPALIQSTLHLPAEMSASLSQT